MLEMFGLGRMRVKKLLKLFLLTIFLLLLMPLISNFLSSHDEREERLAKDLKRKIEIQKRYINTLLPIKVDTAVPQNPINAPGRDVHQDSVLQGPDGAENIAGRVHPSPITPKHYGPKATFSDGIPGNFEPKLVTQLGPGENGEPVYTSMKEKSESDRSMHEFGFNMLVSDKIAMNRTIPDTRMEECKYWNYPTALPSASVVIVFHNEGWSTLMRTIHSIINTSPPQYLTEVVMVDDFSSKEHLKSKLEEYIKQFNGLVKLHRNTERLGLIRTRTLGAKYSVGEVIVFLDAHCECNRNWLVPLLARIAYDRTIMAVPTIDGIDMNNFRYRPVYAANELYRGIFEWGFLYKESKVPQKELIKRAHDSEPYWAPTHAGGLFAMNRNYFFELGAYDPGLLIWGGENFELSFKIWMCGGSIEWVPCSRVGHVYRASMPYGFGGIKSKIPIILNNYMRVVEVWLDPEFKEYFYTREPTVRGFPIANISDQLEFKQKHKCKSFKWFMDNIAYEVYEKFPPPPPNLAWGEIIQRHGYQCWDTRGQGIGGGPIGLSSCHHMGGNQLFRLNRRGQMGVGERCLDAKGSGITIQFCPVEPAGPWNWDKETGLIRHNEHRECVKPGKDGQLMLHSCNPNDEEQQWNIKEIKIF